MNRSELVRAVAEQSGVSATDVDSTLSGLFEVVAGQVGKEDGEKISITGFMSFERTRRKARKGRNPATGEPMDIPAGYGVKITAGKKLKDIASGKASAGGAAPAAPPSPPAFGSN